MTHTLLSIIIVLIYTTGAVCRNMSIGREIPSAFCRRIWTLGVSSHHNNPAGFRCGKSVSSCITAAVSLTQCRHRKLRLRSETSSWPYVLFLPPFPICTACTVGVLQITSKYANYAQTLCARTRVWRADSARHHGPLTSLVNCIGRSPRREFAGAYPYWWFSFCCLQQFCLVYNTRTLSRVYCPSDAIAWLGHAKQSSPSVTRPD